MTVDNEPYHPAPRWSSEEPNGAGAPHWMWVGVVATATSLALGGAFGVSLAMIGIYRWWLALGLTVVGTAAAVPLILKIIRHEARSSSTSRAWAVGAALTLTVLAVWSASQPGQHVITYHDPGVYASTAAILERQGGLLTSVGGTDTEPLVAATLDDSPGAMTIGPGAYEVEPGQLEYQFSHAPSTVLSVIDSVGGHRLLFGFTAIVTLVGLAAVYLLATRFVAPPFAFAAAVSLGISIPVLYVSRSTYSEPFTLLTVCAGLALICRPGRLGVGQAALAGFLLGSSMLFRVDGQLVVVAMIAVGVVAAISGTPWRPLASGLAAASVPTVLGLIDLAVFSTPYWNDHNTYGRVLAGVGIVGIVAAGLVTRFGSRPQFEYWWVAVTRRLAVPLSGAVAVVLVWAWLVRPSTQVARADWVEGSNYAIRIEGIQLAAGLAPDGTRSYAELTVASIGWYLGPFVVGFAIVGLSMLLFRAVRTMESPAGRLIAFFGIAGAVYLVDWQITPYQPWASRRFVTVVLPIFVVAAGVTATWLHRVICGWSFRSATSGTIAGWGCRAALVVLLAMLVAPAAIVTWPVRNLADQRGFAQVVEQSCALADGGTVLNLGHDQLAIPLRAWCGVPTVSIIGDAANASALTNFVANARQLCEPAVVTIVGDRLRPVVEEVRRDAPLGELVEVAHTNVVFPEESVVGPPQKYVDQSIVVGIASVELPDGC